MFFPKRNAYGASSIAGNEEKLEALQNEFDNVKKKLDDDLGEAASLEKKVKVRTLGYEMRAKEVIGEKLRKLSSSWTLLKKNLSASVLCRSKNNSQPHTR
ncbi:hypothetical protein ABKV19_018118 [Rosa sericea]